MNIRTGLSSSMKIALIISILPFTNPINPTRPKATPVDLLSILGPPESASRIDPITNRNLKSCLKFLVPFHPTPTKPGFIDVVNKPGRRRWMREECDENELIWWPPKPVLELARLCFHFRGFSDPVYFALDPTIIPVPDVEGSKECKCQLTRTPYGRHFIHEELNAYMKFLFELIVSRGPSVGLNVSLSRYDFFHGHLFLAKETGRLGILFHAKEYPVYTKQVFPYYMGYCQKGSNVAYDEEMNLRNILWLAPMPSSSGQDWVAPGVLVVLDAHPEGIIYRDLIPDYVKNARTLYEDDFGEVVVDVNYLNVGGASQDYELFIC